MARFRPMLQIGRSPAAPRPPTAGTVPSGCGPGPGPLPDDPVIRAAS